MPALKVTLPFLPRTLMRGLMAYGTARAVCSPFQAVFVQTRRPQEGPAPVRPLLPRPAPSRSVSGTCVRATAAHWQRVTSSAMRFRISPCALLRSARSSWARGRALPQRPFQLTLGPHHLWPSPPAGPGETGPHAADGRWRPRHRAAGKAPGVCWTEPRRDRARSQSGGVLVWASRVPVRARSG